MFKFEDLSQVSLEITNRCQAECPMCPRNIHGGLKNPLMKFNDWTIGDFISIFNYELVRQINVFTFCGNFGDPVMNNDLIAMCNYIKEENPLAIINIYTNGSLRSNDWWASLIKSLTKNHIIAFALDGLSDTHALHRINTSYEKVIKNATSFINSGGRASWHYIRFKHNAHQVEDARKLATSLGFKEFIIKDSRRFTSSSFTVVDKLGNPTHILEPLSHIPIVDKMVLENTYASWSTSKKIKCYALDDKEIFIDAHFTVMPCCILASFLYTSYDQTLLSNHGLFNEASSVNNMGGKIKQQVLNIVQELGGFQAIDAKKVGVKNIVDTNLWNSIWRDKWENNGSLTCMVMCSKDSPFISLDGQTVEKIQVNN